MRKSEATGDTPIPGKSEKQKMLDGELYSSFDDELTREREHARHLTRIYNMTTEKELDRRRELLRQLFGEVGENICIEPPFYCDYGYNIFPGRDVYMNFGCAVLDCNKVEIGDGVLLGPYVQVYAAYHPTDPEERLTKCEYAAPIRIGNNVWIGGGAIICPRVTIGENTTIGAGSVVMKNIPANVVAAGNPCRVLRRVV